MEIWTSFAIFGNVIDIRPHLSSILLTSRHYQDKVTLTDPYHAGHADTASQMTSQVSLFHIKYLDRLAHHSICRQSGTTSKTSSPSSNPKNPTEVPQPSLPLIYLLMMVNKNNKQYTLHRDLASRLDPYRHHRQRRRHRARSYRPNDN